MDLSIAPGKIIVTGEYVGIFGEPVTLTSVDLETKVRIIQDGNENVSLYSDRYPNDMKVSSLEELRGLWKSAVSQYQKYLESGDVSLLKMYRSTPLFPATLAVACAVSNLGSKQITTGFSLEINSILPVGSGLGSSASMSAAIIGAIMTTFHQLPDLETLNNLTYFVEKILNGKPSGADNSAVIYGGWLRYQRDGEKMKLTRLDAVRVTKNWWLIDGGKPSETTLDLIDKVLNLKKKNKKMVDELIKRDRVVTELVQMQIKQGLLKPDFLHESQAVLEEFGVIGEKGKNLIKLIISSGGQAKVSGAGGISSGVGTILCYHEDEEKLRRLAIKEGFRYSPVILGGLGWRIEK